MDTASDARVLVLEDALRRLNEIVSNRKLKLHIEYSALQTLLNKAGGLLYEVKYSYLDAKSLAKAPPTIAILELIEEFGRLFSDAMSSGYMPKSASEQLALAELEYSIGIITGFQERLEEYDDDPGHAVDILAVEISKKRPIEGSDNLEVCRCTDGGRIWSIVTNLKNITSGMRLCCAVLPPVEMMGIISEAMFLGANELDNDTNLGKLNQVPPAAIDQARAQVKEITKRMK